MASKTASVPRAGTLADVRRDAYILINALADQMYGYNGIQAVDTSTFMDVAANIQACGVESLFNAMSDLVGRTIFSARPYRGKFEVMRVLYERWGAITRKVVFLDVEAEATQSYNTADGTPLENGQSVDMYKINNPGVIQLSMYKILSLQEHFTRFRHQINTALSSESEFISFWDAFMVEVQNGIESKNEARRRMVALNAIAGAYAMGNYVDLAEGYNAKYGTQYSRAQLLSTHLKDFMLYAAAEIKKASKAFTDRNALNTAKIQPLEQAGKRILHHTPTRMQRMLMYAPAMIDQETIVMPELFGPDYIKIMGYEEVNYWQNPNNPSAIQINPVILDTATGGKKAAGEQSIPYVLAYLFDIEHMGTTEHFQGSDVTPLNAAGEYWNIYYHWLFGGWNDFTEKHVLFIVGDGGEGQIDTTYVSTTADAAVTISSGGETLVIGGNNDMAVPIVNRLGTGGLKDPIQTFETNK